jgi:hypothetical protein
MTITILDKLKTPTMKRYGYPHSFGGGFLELCPYGPMTNSDLQIVLFDIDYLSSKMIITSPHSNRLQSTHLF